MESLSFFSFFISLVMETSKLNNERIVAKYIGSKPGPLLIAIGAMHGNEPMGIKAIAMLEKMLDVEPITNPGFVFNGTFIGMIGNLTAYKRHERFIDKDINRQWSPSNIERIKNAKPEDLDTEDKHLSCTFWIFIPPLLLEEFLVSLRRMKKA